VSDAWRSTRHSGPQFDFGVLAIMPPLPRGRAIEWSGDGSAREVDEELTEASRQRARSIDPLAGAAYLQRKCAKCEEEDEEEEDDDEESASRMGSRWDRPMTPTSARRIKWPRRW
jgi:hypothetical protein